jgi:RNA polymerase sigma-70 factor (ECF subfamily)
MTSADPEQQLCQSWSIGRLRPWLQIIADRELPARLRGRLDPSDVVQQTLLKAWQGESDFCGSTHEERLAWLRTIVKNTIRDHQRRLLGTAKRGGGRERPAADLFAEGDPGLSVHAVAPDRSVSGVMIDAEEALALADALQQLPPDQRRVIELRHFNELSHAAIARKLNKSQPAVRMLWVRALRNLQQLHQQASGSQRAEE